MIVQNVSGDGATTDVTFTVPASDYERATETLIRAKGQVGYERIDGANDVAKVSVIGIGMRSHAGVAAKAFKALAEKGINIRAITPTEIKFSLVIDANYPELAGRPLPSLYELDKNRPRVPAAVERRRAPPPQRGYESWPRRPSPTRSASRICTSCAA